MSHAKASRIRRLSSALASAVLAVLAVFALLLVVLGVVARPGHDGISRVGGHPILTVLSGSMVPVFRPGDLAIDQPVTASQASHLAVGDIITFHVPGSATQLITHKIVAVKVSPGRGLSSTQVNYQTRGVANNAPDPDLVSPNQVVGMYSWRVPFGGYFLQAVQKKVVFFFLILLPLLYLIVSEITKRWKEPEAQTPEPAAESASEQRGLHEQPIRCESATWDWDRLDLSASTSTHVVAAGTEPAFVHAAETVTGEGGHASA